MSTPAQPPNPPGNAPPIYQPTPLGGTLVMPTPLPDVVPYPLRPDQFLTVCDGEMSRERSIRDVCIGAFLTGIVGVAGLYFEIDWDSAIRQGRSAPFVVSAFLCVLVLVALIVGFVENQRMKQTRTRSSYSRLIQTVADYFGIPVPS